ncbi:MAG TPA: alanine:cation symporter family protein [Candidatus Corynebacterium gallistercoris]|uniref:Alanine:cation symporter family protein n=1 Tax=Candidatus Corynebacterium gallistercoris TaxID=2838530 RepID=A0A9D1RYP4_9CORY|nr:alanine:cation symporter family protein [Candidatus Corynebacterium gallistercoris]
METIESFVVDTINDNAWKVIPFLLLAAGAYFGIRTLVVQVRMLPDMFRTIKEKPNGKGSKDISAFQAFTISAASRVGTGNIVGVAIAITLGGPGAVFWMWMIAIIGGATAFVESTLAQLWKTRDGDGYVGGPAYYMTRGLNARWLAVIFGVAITITYGFVYNAVQTNSIVDALNTSFGIETMGGKALVGGVIAALTGLVIFGGVHRIARVTQLVVPFMAVAYIIIGIIVLAINITEIPSMIGLIVGHALGFKEVAGAALGAAFMNGMRRGLFSNEAGQGSAPNAAATAAVSHPAKQGLVQTLGVYFDTLIVCSITAFIILLSNPAYGEGVQTANLTQNALASEVGSWGIHFITFVLFFLAFSSVLGNYYLAQANVEYFTRKPAVLFIFRLMVVACVFGGALGTVELVWSLADTFAATMVIINLVAIVPLGGVAIKLLKDYSQQKAQGKDPVFHRDSLPGVKNIECWDGTDPETQEGARSTPQNLIR